MALYSETVMDHFRNPRNAGVIENADEVGEVGNTVRGDIMKIYLKIKDGIVSDVKFETFGYSSAITSNSMAIELIKNNPLSFKNDDRRIYVPYDQRAAGPPGRFAPRSFADFLNIFGWHPR